MIITRDATPSRWRCWKTWRRRRTGLPTAVPVPREVLATAGRSAAPRSFGAVRLKLDVVLQAGLLNQHELRLDEIDAALLALQNLRQQLAGRVVPHCFAGRDGLAEIGSPLVLQLQIAFQDL